MEQKNKILPELRFPEFVKDGEWNQESISSTCEVLNNRRKPITGSERKKGIYPYYGASGIIDYVDNYIFDEKLLLIGEDGAKWGAYENTAFIVDGKYWVNNHAHVLKPVGITHKLLESYLVKLDIHSFITGAAPPKLTLGKLKEIPIPVPKNPKEQQKIADCLSSLDELIVAHQDKLEALKNHKKGLLQNLFPQEGQTVPNYRFPEFMNDGDWKVEKLESYIDLFSGIPLKSNEITDDKFGIPILRGINITEGYIRHSNDIDKYFLGEIDNIEKYFVKENDIVIGMDGSKVGKNVALIKKKDENSILIQRVARIRTIKNAETHFIYQYFISNKFRDYVDKVNTSSGIPHISAQQIKDFKVGIPTKIQEQQKIADCLLAVDNLITAQTEKIEQLKAHKKGLMQGLFPKIEE